MSETPQSRTPVSTRTRFEIFKRDRFTCQYCGTKPPNVILHVDHILAVVSGGTNDADNKISFRHKPHNAFKYFCGVCYVKIREGTK